MTVDLDPATIRSRVLVNAREAAWLARVHHTRWWGIAKRSPVLRRARRKRDGRTFWLTSQVIKWTERGGAA